MNRLAGCCHLKKKLATLTGEANSLVKFIIHILKVNPKINFSIWEYRFVSPCESGKEVDTVCGPDPCASVNG